MNISIDDAIDLHECINNIEKAPIDNTGIIKCMSGGIEITFTRDFQNIKILEVSINDHESLKAKEKLQEYFDE